MKDREPRVTLRAMGVGGHVTPVATIPLSVAATDDFGLAAAPVAGRTDDRGRGEVRAEDANGRRFHCRSPRPSRPVLDHQVRHESLLQADPPQVGTIFRFVAEAEDRCARGAQTGRSSVLQMQVVSPDELFYEILIRQRAERAKFIAVARGREKQTPVLAGPPSSEDFSRSCGSSTPAPVSSTRSPAGSPTRSRR